MRDVLNRNILILCLAQMIFVSGSILMVTLGGIIGSQLASNPALATLPLSLVVIGTALNTIPATLLMQRIGRRLGYALAGMVACAAALLAAWALTLGSFPLFCTAALVIGTTLAFSQQFRFGAAESVAAHRVSWAVSIILLGSIGGAFLGPQIAASSPALTPDHPFRAAMLILAGLYACTTLLLLALHPTAPPESTEAGAPGRPLRYIVTQPLFVLAVAAGMIGQGVMVFIMTATPLSMHVVDGHSVTDAAGVVRAHVIAMYLPSLISAPLIGRFGTNAVMGAGLLAMLATLAIGLSGHEVMHYWWALVLLGIGWNFLYVGGTTLLVRTYLPSERFRAQAVNEFSIFGVAAVASLMAGTLIHSFGWTVLLLCALPPLLLMVALLVWRLRHPDHARLQAASAG
ncbi:MAG: MFS transporter [Pseudomonadales bacterium]|nr:MFS transporter [Pseudomonadales bacterium]